MSRGHRFGHHEPMEETLALLAATATPQVFLKSDSGFAVGPSAGIPASPTDLLIIAEAGTVTVTAGQFIVLHTSVEYDAGAGGTGQNVTQTIQDAALTVWDTSTQSVVTSAGEVVSRSKRLGPVGAGGQPAAGTYKFAVHASVGGAGAPTITASQASIVVEVTNG